ncbi:MAG: mechanosensitive ion channel domain-containing protein [Bacteroidota bacterium]
MRLLLNIDWSFFDKEYLHEKVSAYVWFAGIILATLLLKKPLANLLMRVSSNLAARYSYMRHKETMGPMLFKPIERLLQIILYFIAVNQLSNILDEVTLKRFMGKKGKMDITLDDVSNHVFLLLFIICLTQVVSRFIDFVYYLRMGKAESENNNSRQQLLPLIKEVSKLVLWIISGFWILGSVCHVNIPALITGLGIGGVAIALAGKETVENFFAAFTILSDKPFVTGDIIKLGETEGMVERIGFRSTRLRNTDGSAYIVPNQNLVSQNLVNLSMRSNRIMKVPVNIRYGISHEALTALMEKIKAALGSLPYIQQPVDIAVESFDKDTFQLVVSYQLPYPLADDVKLPAVKREVNIRVYEIASANASLGTAPAATP